MTMRTSDPDLTGSDWAGFTGERVSLAALDAVEGGPAVDPCAKLGVRRWSDWHADDLVASPYLVPGVLVAGGIAMLVAEPKVGKSWLSYELAVSIASGQPFMHRYAVGASGPVLIIATEGSQGASRDRLAAIARGHGIDPTADLPIDISWRPRIDIGDPHDAAMLAHLATGYRLIIVDTLARAWSGDENNNREANALLRQLDGITATGCTVLLVHHSAKTTDANQGRRHGQRIRGASAWHAGLDSGLYLERPVGAEATRCTVEQKDVAPIAPFVFAWPTETVDGSASVVLAATDAEQTATRAATTPYRDRILTALQDRPGVSKSWIATNVRGTKQMLLREVDALIAAGDIDVRDAGLHIGSRTTANQSEPVGGSMVRPL